MRYKIMLFFSLLFVQSCEKQDIKDVEINPITGISVDEVFISISEEETPFKMENVYGKQNISRYLKTRKKPIDIFDIQNYQLESEDLSKINYVHSLTFNYYNFRANIPEVVFSLEGLRFLYITNAKILKTDRMKKLSHIFVDNCIIRDYEILNSEKINNIDIRNQDISNWKPDFYKLKELQELSIYNCDVYSYNLQNIGIDVIKLCNNNLQEFPKELTSNNITEISLDGNNIKKIPEFVYKMSNLELLSLKNNPINNKDIKKLKEVFGNKVKL